MEYHCAFESPRAPYFEYYPYMYRYLSEGWADNDTSNQTELGAAVLERSESRIVNILRRCPESMWELNRRGESVLHLCCGWPKGMTILLERGAKPLIHQWGGAGNPSEDCLPLHYTLGGDCTEVVSILLQNDSPVLVASDCCGNFSLSRLFYASSEIVNQVIAALVDRRRRLQELATASLPLAALQELDLDSDRIVDEKATMLQDVCSENDILLPPSLSVPDWRTTVYHKECLNPEIAERLYNLGFRDICGRDCSNQTPLATINFLAQDTPSGETTKILEAGLTYATWLVSKDPGALRSVQGTERDTVLDSAAHRFARKMSHLITMWIERIFDERQTVPFSRLARPSTSFTTLRAVLAADWTDNCTCACSSNGCLPHKIFLRSCRLNIKWTPSPASKVVFLKWCLAIMRWLDSSQDPDFVVPTNVWTDLIRLETFDALGLTHICCDNYGYRINDSEAEEIRDEEQDLIDQLEDLMLEFESEFLTSGSSIVTFLEDCWNRRMSEVLSEQDPVEYAKLREIGVILDSNPILCSRATPDPDAEEGSDPHVNARSESDESLGIDKEQISEALSDSDDEYFEPGECCDS
ncbi:hypothetical protein EV356DRAFT_470285 [Viridothelium virens]|uniref:Ankyrin n=1 Tax=Viridothelium virens TaxID=1048519 RepID=A0A6A6H2W8_VIRVR|nr:hypothetical protein EV356DRAFT_470285 [Viridothelium virens]